MTIKQMRMFGVEPKYIILPETDSDNEYMELLDVVGCKDRICTYKEYMSNHYNADDIFIGCYISTIKKKNMQVLRFKVQRKLSQKFKNIQLKNPVSDILTARTFPYLDWFWNRDYYDFMLYHAAHIKEIEDLYDSFQDDESRDTLVELIRVFSENDKIYRLNEHRPEDKYWECYRHLDNEKWVNCGSCEGDTIGWYIYKKYEYERIDAFEGDENAFEELKKNMSRLGKLNINMCNEYIGLDGDDITNFNARYADRDVTLINMDIEGAETAVLKGACDVIAKQKPVLAVCAYHKPSDLIEIPKIVLKANADYAVYLRKYSSLGGKPWEYVYYFVPQDRKLETI